MFAALTASAEPGHVPLWPAFAFCLEPGLLAAHDLSEVMDAFSYASAVTQFQITVKPRNNPSFAFP